MVILTAPPPPRTPIDPADPAHPPPTTARPATADSGAMSPRYARPERDRSLWWDRLWEPFWVLPAAIALGSALVGVVLPQVDQRLRDWTPYVFESGPDGARQLLGTIASAMISVTGLVFSITMVVLQLASSQFTPRLLGQFLQSRVVQITLGVFTGSFVYSLTVLRLVRGGSSAGAEFVPQASVTLAFGYVLAAVAFFVAFIQHITQSVRLSHVVSRIGRRTRESAEDLHNGERSVAQWAPPPDATSRVLECGDRRGMVTSIDSTGLARWAAERDCVVELDLALGDYLTAGDRMGQVWGGAAEVEVEEAGGFIDLSSERMLACDFGYGVRQLTDIADRALSPGINDPTSAVRVVDELYSILRPLAAEPDLSPCLVDEEGVVRATYRAQTFAALVDISLAEIADYASDSPRVLRRIDEVVGRLLDDARPEHRDVLLGLRERLGRPVEPLPSA